MRKLDRYLQQMRIRQVLPFLSRDARVLDIGCADGSLQRFMPPEGQYVGIDPDAPLELNRPGVRFIRDIFPSSVLTPAADFDLVTALAILEHIPRERQAQFAAACAGHLRPGGTLGITVPSPAVDRILALLKAVRLVDGMHEEQHSGYSPDQTTPLFVASGLQLGAHTTFELGLNHLFIFRKPLLPHP
jgi:2-polyprenyl-3-methyl-5-hydroxy-6-metoxy-1,4-benzoquinol methylase